VILEPIAMGWDWLHDLHAMGPLDDDAVLSTTEDLPVQEREKLDVFK